VVGESVPPVWSGAGLTHADEVRREAPSLVSEIGKHVAPQVGPRRVAMKEDHRLALANVGVAHAGAADSDALALVLILSLDCHSHPPVS
jgi:hypothetical protein